MTDLRCPVDGKLFFQYEAGEPFAGTLSIKCRGRCGQCWSIRGLAGIPAIEAQAAPTPPSPSPSPKSHGLG